MEWFWIIVAAGGAGFAAKWWRDRQATRRTTAEQLEGVRRLAGEDITYLQEQLQRLDREIGGQVLDQETRVAHQTVLDSCESAQRTLEQVSNAEAISKVTETLATGLCALACVRARLAGRPVPEQQVVCFFNPLHGPSVTEVLWTRPGHGARRVPECSTDADRLTNKVLPEARTVKIGARTMPYWAAGSAFLPYTQGYFAGVAALSWALQPAAVEAAPETTGYFGHGIVGSRGHFDGGGFDRSGGHDFRPAPRKYHDSSRATSGQLVKSALIQLPIHAASRASASAAIRSCSTSGCLSDDDQRNGQATKGRRR